VDPSETFTWVAKKKWVRAENRTFDLLGKLVAGDLLVLVAIDPATGAFTELSRGAVLNTAKTSKQQHVHTLVLSRLAKNPSAIDTTGLRLLRLPPRPLKASCIAATRVDRHRGAFHAASGVGSVGTVPRLTSSEAQAEADLVRQSFITQPQFFGSNFSVVCVTSHTSSQVTQHLPHITLHVISSHTAHARYIMCVHGTLAVVSC
jgi:hypothetical protein